MNHGIPEDIRWLIEAKVRLSGESSNSFISYMLGTGKSTFAKKRRAKRLKVCHRFAKWICNATCRSLGMVSINREDKIQFIKDDLSKGSLDNLLLTLETHPFRGSTNGTSNKYSINLFYSIGNHTQGGSNQIINC
jgi:hypothetical protein